MDQMAATHKPVVFQDNDNVCQGLREDHKGHITLNLFDKAEYVTLAKLRRQSSTKLVFFFSY